MKNKIRTVLAALLLACWQAMAFWIIALIIIIVAVAGYVIYELYRTAKQHLYGDHASISRIEVSDAHSMGFYDVAYTSDTNDIFSGRSAGIFQEGFTISFGITNSPWVSLGESPEALLDGPSNMQFDESGNLIGYTLVVTMNGQVVKCIETLDGWVSTVLQSDTNLYDAVIERSTDMANWFPVATNQILRWSVNNWTDSDPPSDRAFYRIKLCQ